MTPRADPGLRAARGLAGHVANTRADAIAAFRAHEPDLALPPVAVVIAALNEEASVRAVLHALPTEACGLATAPLVVDDGSTDRTSAVARAAGARVVRLERNCGHGVALRVGYQLAREHGARFIVTLDADGQWDPTELPAYSRRWPQTRPTWSSGRGFSGGRRPRTDFARLECTCSRR